MSDQLNVLHLEDNELDAELVQARLKHDGVPAEVEVVHSPQLFQMALRSRPVDVILADYMLPGYDGLAALAQARQQAPDVPFIFVSGEMGEDRAIETLREGATDYVLKTRLSRLGSAVQRAVAEARERAARRRAEEAMHREREWLRVTLTSIGDAVIAVDTARRVTFLNPVAEALTGWPEAEAVGRPIGEVFPIVNETTRQAVENPVDQVLREGVIAGLANHTVLLRRDGPEVPVDDSGAPIRDLEGRLIGVILVFRDITKRRAAERELQSAHATAQRAAERLQRLLAVSARLAQAATPAEVVEVAVREGLQAAQAAAGTAFLLDESGRQLVQAFALNYPAPPVEAYSVVPVDAPVPVAEAHRSGQAVFISSTAELWERFSAFAAPRRPTSYEGLAAIPLRGRGGPRGALGFSFAEANAFAPDDRQLLVSLAEQCAQALERAELYAAAQRLNADLDARVRERTASLEAANAALAVEGAERRRAEQKLEEWREAERARLARELHDELGGRITGLKMDLSRAARAEHLPAPTKAALDTALRDIDAMVGVVRRIAHDLRPSVLDDFGLVAALETHFAEFRARAGVQGTFTSAAEDVPVRGEAATTCYRIFQEALTNVARHARATRVDVTLAVEGGEAVLRVADDGLGMAPEALSGAGRLGLIGMRERAALIAATLAIESAPGQGTVVVLRVPLEG